MDLGLKGRKAIVCGSSRGLGRACAEALAEAGASVVVNGRDAARLEAAAKDIAARTGARVVPVAADVSTEAGRAALLAACPDPDVLVTNADGPPPKPFRKITAADVAAGVNGNMITPIALIQAVIDGMIERRYGRIVNITSGSVKSPITGLDVSSGARAGLTAFLAGPAREVAHANVTINNILPGQFDTDRLKTATARMAEMRGLGVDEMMKARREAIPAKRFGTPEEFGQLCAFLSSQHAGYITGQNFLIDGGLFPGAF
ncbi:MAG: SDR family oxidoreductase [Rhizobiales bacterium]|nr:SDR family oxidoreductase [Hyphomicrobiales bacterium]